MNQTLQARQPKGIPVGGQFATSAHGESGVSLKGTAARAASLIATPAMDKFFGDAERHQALLDGGYVPATVLPAMTDPRNTRGRDLYWAQAFVAAEHKDGDDTYPVLPDNYTPSMRSGKALHGRSEEGNLRTYRTKWTDDGVTFRMPSKNSLNAFSKEVGGTFRVPFSAVDERTGRTIQTEALITNHGGGSWSVDCASLTGASKAMVTEAITSRLEKRRPAKSPAKVGATLDAARRAAQADTLDATGLTKVRVTGADGMHHTMPLNSALADRIDAGQTLLVPVESNNPATGKQSTSLVAVTNNGDKGWAVTSRTGAQSALTRAVEDRINDRKSDPAPERSLIERAKARAAASGAQIAPTKNKSTWISAVGYNAAAGVMFTETSNGSTYGHHVDAKTFEAVRGNKSPGAAFTALVKGSPRAAVDRCGSCQAVYATANGHTCAKPKTQPTPGPKHSNVVARAAAAAVAATVAPRVARRQPKATA